MTNTSLLHKIALTKIAGLGVATTHKLLKAVENVDNIFSLSVKELVQGCKLNAEVANRLKSAETLHEAEKELSFIEKKNINTYFSLTKPIPNV